MSLPADDKSAMSRKGGGEFALIAEETHRVELTEHTQHRLVAETLHSALRFAQEIVTVCQRAKYLQWSTACNAVGISQQKGRALRRGEFASPNPHCRDEPHEQVEPLLHAATRTAGDDAQC